MHRRGSEAGSVTHIIVAFKESRRLGLKTVEANELACDCFVDAARRYETPGSEAKKGLYYSKCNHQSVSMIVIAVSRAFPPGPMGRV